MKKETDDYLDPKICTKCINYMWIQDEYGSNRRALGRECGNCFKQQKRFKVTKFKSKSRRKAK